MTEVHKAVAQHVRMVRCVEDFIRKIEVECAISGIDADKLEILVAILNDIEEIAHKETGDGPGFLADIAAERRQFRLENSPPDKGIDNLQHN